jgi:hypothetical protein
MKRGSNSLPLFCVDGLIQGAVTWAFGEIIVVWLNVFCQVDHFTGLQFSSSFEDDTLAVVVLPFPMSFQANPAEKFTATCGISRGNFVLREDRFIWALGDACPAVNAGIWIDVVPGPLLLGFPRDDALDWTNIHAT